MVAQTAAQKAANWAGKMEKKKAEQWAAQMDLKKAGLKVALMAAMMAANLELRSADSSVERSAALSVACWATNSVA